MKVQPTFQASMTNAPNTKATDASTIVESFILSNDSINHGYQKKIITATNYIRFKSTELVARTNTDDISVRVFDQKRASENRRLYFLSDHNVTILLPRLIERIHLAI